MTYQFDGGRSRKTGHDTDRPSLRNLTHNGHNKTADLAAADGSPIFNRKLRRAEVLRFFEKTPACLVGMEACGSAHYWAREIRGLGHEVRLIPPVYVKPFVKRGKTDAANAEAISEAMTRRTMRARGTR